MELFDVEVVDDLGEDETGEDDVGHNFTEGLFEAVLNDSRRYKKEYFNFLVTIPRTTTYRTFTPTSSLRNRIH